MKVDRRSVGETRAAPGERSPTRSSCQRPTEWPAARADQDPSRSCRSSSNRNQREEETAVRRGWPSGELPLGIAAEGDSAQILTWCPSSRGANDHYEIRIVYSIEIHHDSRHHAAQLDQMMPVATIARQSRCFDTQHSPNFSRAYFSYQALKSRALD